MATALAARRQRRNGAAAGTWMGLPAGLATQLAVLVPLLVIGASMLTAALMMPYVVAEGGTAATLEAPPPLLPGRTPGRGPHNVIRKVASFLLP